MWVNEKNYYKEVLMDRNDYHIHVEKQVIHPGTFDLIHTDKICGYYILDGEMTYFDQSFHKDELVWITGGESFLVHIKDNLNVIYMETEKSLEDTFSYQLFDEASMNWNMPLHEGMTTSKHMITPEEFGVKIQVCIYTKDFVHEWHTHSCAHGFYVLSGMLEYDFKDGRKGLYGPGEFISSRKDEEILHVQAPDTHYCKYLFIGDGPFDFIVNGVNIYGK